MTAAVVMSTFLCALGFNVSEDFFYVAPGFGCGANVMGPEQFDATLNQTTRERYRIAADSSHVNTIQMQNNRSISHITCKWDAAELKGYNVSALPAEGKNYKCFYTANGFYTGSDTPIVREGMATIKSTGKSMTMTCKINNVTDKVMPKKEVTAALQVFLGCFHGDSNVLTPSGLVKVRDLAIGDKVQSVDAAGNAIMDDVVFLPHASASKPTLFYNIHVAGSSTPLRLTGNHFVTLA